MASNRPLALLTEFTAQAPREAIDRIVHMLRTRGPAGLGEGRLDMYRGLAPEVRRNLDALLDAWQTLGNRESALELAAALEASLAQAEYQRASGRIELVWTGPKRPEDGFRSTEQVLLEVINAARETLYVVTFAAYKVPTLRAAIRDAIRLRGVRVCFILESPDASDGKVSFDPAAAFNSDDGGSARFYVWPLESRERGDDGQYGSLHAKFVLADSGLLFVSSANLTEHAMRLNIELGVLVRGGSEPARVKNNLEALIRRGVFQDASAG